MKLLYQGVRKVTRKSWVGTGPDAQGDVAETQVSTVELYDLQGRLHKVIEPEGLTAEYTYDTEDRLTRARLFGPTAQVRSFSYDPRGFLLSETHPESGTTTYSQVDARGKATRQASAAGITLRTSYDVAERVTRVEDITGATTLQGRLKTVAGVVDNMTYHANGLVARVDRANGTADVITPDPAGHPRPYTLDVVGPWGTSGLGEHLYDGSGNLVQVGLGTDNRYHYDGVGRLIRFGLDSGQWQEYDDDPYGNLTTLRHHDGSTTTTRTFAVNTATNRLSVAGYDADGNLLAWADETYA